MAFSAVLIECWEIRWLHMDRFIGITADVRLGLPEHNNTKPVKADFFFLPPNASDTQSAFPPQEYLEMADSII